MATNDAQMVVWRWDSDAFGSTLADEDPDGESNATTVNLRFPGQYYDAETGFHYNYFRTYDPSTGRYMESDPIGLGGGLNTYGYVGGNPLSYSDPFGLDKESEYYTDAVRDAFNQAVDQYRAQNSFERYQELCDLYGGQNCDEPQNCPTDEGAVDAYRTFIDVFSISSGLYGSSSVPVLNSPVRTHIYGTTPGGRPLTAHYSNTTGPNRNIPGSVVDNTIDTTTGVRARSGKTVHYDPVNNVTVVTGDGKSIVSERRGPPRQGQ